MKSVKGILEELVENYPNKEFIAFFETAAKKSPLDFAVCLYETKRDLDDAVYQYASSAYWKEARKAAIVSRDAIEKAFSQLPVGLQEEARAH